jgi:DNA-binding NarL/FixJ family response regulator
LSGESPIAAEEQDTEGLARAIGMGPTVIMSDTDDIDEVSTAIERGARGFIPTSLSLDVMIEALRLVRAGGVFVPASSLIPALRLNDTRNSGRDGNTMFTARQVAVVKALSKGKANKIIAHELNMREGTVKVHVRNIMKKLNAKNRTEVALMASRLLQEPVSAG